MNCPNANQGRGGPCNGHCCDKENQCSDLEFLIISAIVIILAVGCFAILVRWAI